MFCFHEDRAAVSYHLAIEDGETEVVRLGTELVLKEVGVVNMPYQVPDTLHVPAQFGELVFLHSRGLGPIRLKLLAKNVSAVSGDRT